ncbi:mediator of RNA polymerase II transcription subunit 19a isoform X3 [Vitis vinifera]|uniref:mediator of RNA polymerase II transcription subunit 19a isoform X3 n=2 Tax=Vitis vinifera TaxID=29760 RepID=UPI0028830756|nr:mediator of RNA polymerase II transcription subunit 19a isoform X3 [Vitis vinifera]
MELDQLFHSTFYLRERNAGIHPFDLDILREAFQMRETTPVELSSAEKGIPTCVPKSKNEPKDKERKHKKSKDKAKDRKKHRHHPKDSSSDKNKDKCRIGNRDSGIEQKQQDKKRKHDGNGDVSYIQSHLKTEVSKLIAIAVQLSYEHVLGLYFSPLSASFALFFCDQILLCAFSHLVYSLIKLSSSYIYVSCVISHVV